MDKAASVIHLDCAREKGINGNGIGIAIMDTGIFPHPDFTGRLTAFYDVLHGRTDFYDDSGHGTHVSGIAGGSGASSNGLFAGVAPKCHLIGVKVLDHLGNGAIRDVINGIGWILENKERYHIRVANISVGSAPGNSSNENKYLIEAIERLWGAGVVVVAAAGNGGPKAGSVGLPGSSRKVITVGACDDHIPIRLGNGNMVDYSGRGPTEECVLKPDIVAPGGHIVSCRALNGRISLGRIQKNRNYINTADRIPYHSYWYTEKSGTSMATPMVSGAVALLLSKYPQMSVREVKIRLKNTSTDLGLPHGQQGWGRLDIEKLLQ